ncbi:MAG: hypothetical protein HWE34_00855 [Methylocystaceae bacterium]|nr:hypothetical protein [Methylocystaceae bacterium]
MEGVKWHYDFQIQPSDNRFIPWFLMGDFLPHTDILDDQAEEILGSEIHWWLNGPECVGKWRLVRFNTFAGPRTALHRLVILFDTQEAYDRFIEEFGQILTLEKANLYEEKYQQAKTALLVQIEKGEFDLSNLGWRHRRTAAKAYLAFDRKIRKYRQKWSTLKARAKVIGHTLEH